MGTALQEANQYALAMEQEAEAQRLRVVELERENAELRARLEATPKVRLKLAPGAIAIQLTPEQSERLRPLVAQVWGAEECGMVLGQAMGTTGKDGDLTIATFRFVEHEISEPVFRWFSDCGIAVHP